MSLIVTKLKKIFNFEINHEILSQKKIKLTSYLYIFNRMIETYV